MKATIDILNAAKAALKAVPMETAPDEVAAIDQVDSAGKEEHSYALANPQSSAMEVSVDNAVNNSTLHVASLSLPSPQKLSFQMILSLMTMFLLSLLSCSISFPQDQGQIRIARIVRILMTGMYRQICLV